MAVAGVGTAFNRWNGSAYVALGEVNSITGPTMDRTTIDTTALDTPGGYKTFITGFRNAGTVTLSMNFTRLTYDLIKDDFDAAAVQLYQIALPDGDNTTLSFDGLVTALPLTIAPEDKITVDVTIQISGSVLGASQ